MPSGYHIIHKVGGLELTIGGFAIGLWAVFGALAGAAWAGSNMFDKYVMNKHVTNFLAFLFIAQIVNGVLSIGMLMNGDVSQFSTYWPHMLLVGGLDVIALSSYVYAIKLDDVSRVVPLFLMAMVFTTIGDAVFLGNLLELTQYFAIGILTTFGFFLAYNQEKGLTHSAKVLGCISLSALAYTTIWLFTETIINDIGALTFTGGLYFMRFLWVPVIGLGYCMCTKSRLIQGWRYIRPYFTPVVIIALFASNGFGVLGMFSFTYALEQDGIPSLVEAMSMSQYILIFILPLIMTALWPHHFHEHVTKKIFLQKLICIVAMVVGGLMLLLSH